jgi:hypothetical protein
MKCHTPIHEIDQTSFQLARKESKADNFIRKADKTWCVKCHTPKS